MALPFRYSERALIVGSTGSGKSELINLLFAGVRCQRVLLDTKDEFSIEGVEPVRDVADIDWRERTVHFIASDEDPVGDCADLFAAVRSRHNVVVAVHELADVCDFNPAKTPGSFNAVLSKGRARGQGLIMGTQRPVQVPVRARSESEHVFFIGEPLIEASDHKAVATAMGQNPAALFDLILGTQHDLGGEPDPHGRRHAFVGFDRNRRQLLRYPPIPPEHRQVIDVGRTLQLDAAPGGPKHREAS